MAQKQVFPIFVSSSKEKYTSLLQELADFISPVSVPLLTTDSLETINESDLVLCIIDKDFWNDENVKAQLKYAKNLNKLIVCIIPDQFGILFKIKNYFHCLGERFHIFNWYDSNSKEKCVLHLIEWLGLLMPMVDVFGMKINLRVLAKKGFLLKIDEKHFNFNGNVEVSFRVKEGNHKIVCTDNRNKDCNQIVSFDVTRRSSMYVSNIEDVVFDLDTLVEEYGYEDTRYEANGDYYEGRIQFCQYNGKGALIKANGDKFSGTFVNGGIDQGTVAYQDGASYEGTFESYQPHGTGTKKFVNGDTYTGEWEAGKMHGKGTYRWNTVSYYEGDFVHDVFEGEGRRVFPNGESYEGSFHNGLFHGQGTFKNADGSVKHEGKWEKGDFKPSTIWGKINKWLNG